MYRSHVVFVLLLVLLQPQSVQATDAVSSTEQGDRLVAEYFSSETAKLTDGAFAGIETLEDWTSRRDRYRRELEEMLGLFPMPERTELHPVVTGTLEGEGFVVERLHFQSSPGLYVTANLYRPSERSGSLPAILYVCGHGREQKDGVSLGNKTHYQHHGAWFARNGYVCLMIDTIQLGEIEGLHHGTYRHNLWWWNNRGYTPAGVEAWNSIRAIDYLQSRDEVDPDRIGMTGRSGGGAYSWWAAALDERIKVAVPVAGITSLKNHVVDGCVEGHCDCMFMVNTYRWDYPMVAALVAPRPLLISNTDKDEIFPLDGVVDVHLKVRQIYKLYGAEANLGLQITEGPHQDTQELRVHAFRWFNRHLKQDESLIETTAIPFFETQQLRVFEELPADEVVTTIQETFVPKVLMDELPRGKAERQDAFARWTGDLREKCFRGWPEPSEPVEIQVLSEVDQDAFHLRAIDYTAQTPYRLTMYVLESIPPDPPRVPQRPAVEVRVLDSKGWDEVAPALAHVFPNQVVTAAPDAKAWQALAQTMQGKSIVMIAPRGVGPTQWTRDEKERIHIRRRFMLLGQTVAGMQIFDVCQALRAASQVQSLGGGQRDLVGRGESAVWALYASLFVDGIRNLELRDLPMSNRDAPDLLNVSRYVEIPQLLMMADDRVEKLVVEQE
ncbi:alpha/beta hydrolase family protein [Novipirellula artificiosorum]|uniref:Acetyl xylan esterase (AXE1) n=1 Tax=Novipirellula artificiosorum TaxID=2528016 RepID=A0A5C6E1T4_9BACT|nr:CocE/NonD family hydrolase [Novipirellula artificiosorum]TWU41109.1 Acetyl xylan esterase (AXE1) [Novipirellula artificiosorum]